MRTPGQSALRKGRWSQAGYAYHVTLVTRDRQPHLVEFAAARIVVCCLQHQASIGYASTLAFVVMPDHVHWLMQLGERKALSSVVACLKSRSARRINRAGVMPAGFAWQAGFHERAVRHDDDVRIMARYIVANPLRAGLVERIGDYPHWDASWL